MKFPRLFALIATQVTLLAFSQGVPSLESARALFLSGKLKEASDMYAALTVVRPNLEEAHLRLVRTDIIGGNVAGAAQAAHQALSDLPNSASAWAAAGDVKFRLSRFTEATASYNHALQLNPNSARAIYGIGRVDQLASMNKTAQTLFQKAYRLAPSDPDIALARAYVMDSPAAVADALTEYLKLPDLRTPAEIEVVQAQIAEARYMGDRQCHVPGAPSAVAISLRQISRSGPEIDSLVGGIGATANGIPVAINNSKPKSFRLLTQSPTVTITRAFAKELRLPRIDGSSSDSKAYTVFADKIRISNIELSNCAVTVADTPFLGAADGSIGLPLLSDFLITLDLRKSSLRLEPLPASGGSTNSKFVDAAVSADKKDFMRVLKQGSSLLIPTKVDNGMESLFTLSLENPFTFVSSSLPSKNLTGGNPTDLNPDLYACTINCAVLKFGQLEVRAAAIPTTMNPAGATIETGGVLGLNAIRGLTLVLDYRDGLIRFIR